MAQSNKANIPKPDIMARAIHASAHAKPSLQEQLGLRDDTQRFDELTESWRLAASQCDIFHVPLVKLPEEKKKEFITKVEFLTPDIVSYESSWPAISYLKLYLDRTQIPVNSKSPRAAIHPKHVRKEDTLWVERPNRGAAKVQVASTVQKVIGRISVGDNRLEDLVQGHQIVGRKLRKTSNARQSSESAESPSASVLNSNVGSRSPSPAPSLASVQSFLDGLAGTPQPQLFSFFQSLGVTSMVYLYGLACMSSRNSWLAELQAAGQLTWLQVAFLNEGLDGLLPKSTIQMSASLNTAQSQTFATVQAFLSSLRPPLSQLLPFLNELGISDVAALSAFARLTARNGHLDEFVAQRKMTPLQMRILRDGLDQMSYQLLYQQAKMGRKA